MPTAPSEIKPENQDPPAEFKTGHGGHRPGAGRKPKRGQTVEPDRPAAEPAAEIKSPGPPAAPPQPLPSRSELTEVRAAANAGWDIPDPVKRKAVFDCARMLADPNVSNREKIAAIRCLASIERLNLKLNAGALSVPSDALALREFLFGVEPKPVTPGPDAPREDPQDR